MSTAESPKSSGDDPLAVNNDGQVVEKKVVFDVLSTIPPVNEGEACLSSLDFEEHILEAPLEFRTVDDIASHPEVDQPERSSSVDRDRKNAPDTDTCDRSHKVETESTEHREKVEGEGDDEGEDAIVVEVVKVIEEVVIIVDEPDAGKLDAGEVGHVGFRTAPAGCGDTSKGDRDTNNNNNVDSDVSEVGRRRDGGSRTEECREGVSVSGMRGACELDVREEEPTTLGPSIGPGVADCASSPGCSRVSDAPACATSREDDPLVADQPPQPPAASESDLNLVVSSESAPSILQVIGQLQSHTEHTQSDLSLEVIAAKEELSQLREESGRLKPPELDRDQPPLLSSKDLNKRTVDSRLRHLEEKLKRAGITDEKCVPTSDTSAKYRRYEDAKKQVVDKSDYDANQNLVREVGGIEIQCEFDATRIGSYAGYGDGGGSGYYVVYDELEDDITDTMRGETATMGTADGDRKQHNPDHDNLKSLLKKPGRGREVKKNRVVFNENRNEFFDADYIILIREDCDYDDEEDDGICTCNQHEMVRLTCCEPNCNCNAYEGYDPTPQSPKFAPPLEFVDTVTLSPPEGYKDMELGEQQLLALQQMARRGQMAAVCRECSQTHEDEGEGSEEEAASDQEGERETTDQSQQTTPTTPPMETEEPSSQRCVQESVVMATAERRTLREVEEERKESTESPTPSLPPGGSPISGILKGGRLWKQQSVDINNPKPVEPQQVVESNPTSDDENGSKRSVRFIESEEGKRDSCDGAPEKPAPEVVPEENANQQKDCSVSPEPTEMMLTFKLGNHVLISNNSLKPNSAVRQLFPCTKPLASKGEDESVHHQYLVTAESLKAFEEAKRSKLPLVQSGNADESIKRAIERNTLRRSLIRYEPRSKKNVQKTDNSLVERIKQLTCDVDEPMEEEQARASPPGEEARNSPEVTAAKNQDKSFSPSSSSSSNSSVSSTYKKITDLFAKRDRPDIQVIEPMKPLGQAPDLGGPTESIEPLNSIAKVNQTTESRKQFLSTLAPLTACVSGTMHPEDYYYHAAANQSDRMSMASSVGTEYSLEDIEEGLRKDEEENKRIAPDVLVGTPSASESGDELAMFVQQDASRIERIKKKYQQDDDDDEHDDYGFNRRPSVRGIKPRFGSTTEILQQIQNQMQPPNNTPPRNAPVAWPYYSETNLSGVDNKRNMNQPPNYQYAQQYRPTTLLDDNMYQNCANQRCTQVTYRSNMNVYSSPIVRVGGGCNEYYQSLPRARGGRPQSPPPQEVSKGFHQTMVYIPYNHIEGYQPPGPYYDQYVRVSNQNQINKRYIDPSYDHYAQKPVRPPYTVINRSESPLPGHFSTARSTQTPAPTFSTCTYYPRYRQPVGNNGGVWTDGNYASKVVNRHSFPSTTPRYTNPDNISLTDSDSQHSGQLLPNGFKDSMPNSPTKPRFIERGVPEGAASVSPQDCNVAQSASTMTSPTSPQNPQATQKPLFYAMNV